MPMTHPSYPYIVVNDLPKVRKPQAPVCGFFSRHAGHPPGDEQADPVDSGAVSATAKLQLLPRGCFAALRQNPGQGVCKHYLL